MKLDNFVIYDAISRSAWQEAINALLSHFSIYEEVDLAHSNFCIRRTEILLKNQIVIQSKYWIVSWSEGQFAILRSKDSSFLEDEYIIEIWLSEGR